MKVLNSLAIFLLFAFINSSWSHQGHSHQDTTPADESIFVSLDEDEMEDDDELEEEFSCCK